MYPCDSRGAAKDNSQGREPLVFSNGGRSPGGAKGKWNRRVIRGKYLPPLRGSTIRGMRTSG